MGPPREADPSLRRVQRDSAAIALSVAMLALAIQRGRPDGALGVLAGAALMAFSYTAIKGGVSAVVQRAAAAGTSRPGRPMSKGRTLWLVTGYIGRYAVVGLAAWVVLVPLRAHPLGLFAGVSVPVAAIAIEAVRLALARPRGDGRRVP